MALYEGLYDPLFTFDAPGFVPIEQSNWYRLEPVDRPAFSLEVIHRPDEIHASCVELAPTSNSPGQYWHLVPSPRHGCCCLLNMALGPSRALDVKFRDGGLVPCIAERGDYASGQWWVFEPRPGVEAGPGLWSLRNDGYVRAPELYFNVDENGRNLGIGIGVSDSQQWRVLKIREIQTGDIYTHTVWPW
ncbi:hypothetical protein QBC39DRAFT_349990 [Podospora conica]|nr:hypothetical protein QBC39DRAFT_349990 [Schizothecium conicum]